MMVQREEALVAEKMAVAVNASAEDITSPLRIVELQCEQRN